LADLLGHRHFIEDGIYGHGEERTLKVTAAIAAVVRKSPIMEAEPWKDNDSG
jgi:hypothetical protein